MLLFTAQRPEGLIKAQGFLAQDICPVQVKGHGCPKSKSHLPMDSVSAACSEADNSAGRLAGLQVKLNTTVHSTSTLWPEMHHIKRLSK
jgi:hypothetical protein